MKKIFKSILAGVMAAAMTVGMAPVMAYAATDQTITIKANGQEGIGEETRFEAYAIFTGEVGTEGDGRQLIGIEWGDGVEHDQLVQAMKDDDLMGKDFSDAYTEWENNKKESEGEAEMVARFLEAKAADHADYVNKFARLASAHLTTQKTVSAKSSDDWTITVPTGYYLVKDTYASGTEAPDGSVSSYILEVVGPQEIDLKASIPTVEKKVETKDGYLSETSKDVNFTLTGTVAQNIDEYTTYSYKFTDKLPAGLTYGGDANLSVTIDGHTVDKTSYSVSCTTEDGQENTLTVTFTDLKACQEDGAGDIIITKDSKVIVAYKAQLNKYAVAGATGNENTVELTYANNPYSAGEGTTAPDTVKTYTLSLDVTKVENTNSDPLQDVGFVLKNEGGQFATLVEENGHFTITGWGDEDGATELKTSTEGKFTIFGLDAGTYTLSEKTPPENYEPMKDVKFEITGGEIQADGALGDVSAALSADDSHRDDVEFDADNKDGTIGVTLTNFKAPILPHTGGIGAMTVLGVSLLGAMVGIFMMFFGLRKKNNVQ